MTSNESSDNSPQEPTDATKSVVNHLSPARFSTPKKAKKSDTPTGDDPNQYTDAYQIGPFRVQVRELSPLLLRQDDEFEDNAIRELGLLERAERFLRRAERNGDIEPIDEGDWDEAVYERARLLLLTEEFRTGLNGPKLSAQYDALVNQRYDNVIFGIGDEPEQWGGLVAWEGPVPSDDPELLRRALRLPLKVEFYQRLIAYTRKGVSDELFRRALGRGRR